MVINMLNSTEPQKRKRLWVSFNFTVCFSYLILKSLSTVCNKKEKTDFEKFLPQRSLESGYLWQGDRGERWEWGPLLRYVRIKHREVILTRRFGSELP